MDADATRRRGALETFAERPQVLVERCRVIPEWPVAVFTSNVGTRLEPRNLYRAFERICEAACVSHTLHGLRHDLGSALVSAGVPIPTIAAILGHASPVVTTRLYLHSHDQAALAAVELAGEMLAQSTHAQR